LSHICKLKLLLVLYLQMASVTEAPTCGNLSSNGPEALETSGMSIQVPKRAASSLSASRYSKEASVEAISMVMKLVALRVGKGGRGWKGVHKGSSPNGSSLCGVSWDSELLRGPLLRGKAETSLQSSVG
jgi:hypothetical protein